MVTDGSSVRELHLEMEICSAAFIFECSKGRGKLVGPFSEQTILACAYREELLGLVAMHFILLILGVNKMNLTLLSGSVHIFSNCLGALDRVENLPPY